MKLLNRIVRVDEGGLSYEADPDTWTFWLASSASQNAENRALLELGNVRTMRLPTMQTMSSITMQRRPAPQAPWVGARARRPSRGCAIREAARRAPTGPGLSGDGYDDDGECDDGDADS